MIYTTTTITTGKLFFFWKWATARQSSSNETYNFGDWIQKTRWNSEIMLVWKTENSSQDKQILPFEIF